MKEKQSCEIYKVRFKMQHYDISISKSMRNALLKVRRVLLLKLWVTVNNKYIFLMNHWVSLDHHSYVFLVQLAQDLQRKFMLADSATSH